MAEHTADSNTKTPPSTSGMDKIALKGESILSTLEKRLEEFSSIAKKVGDIGRKVETLSEDVSNIKRKNDLVDDDQDKGAKRPRVENGTIPRQDVNISDNENSDSDIDEFLRGEDSSDDEESEDIFNELDSFFVIEEEVGEDVDDKLAHISNKALKNRPNEENMKDLKNKHKRPKNIEYLQIPKIENIIWQQLRPSTKATDFQLQKNHAALASVAVPIIKAVGLLQKSDQKIRPLLTDAFKMVTSMISSLKVTRREKIKRELDNKYKSIAENDQTAEKLFGDNIGDKIKALGDSKISLVTAHAGKSIFRAAPQTELPGETTKASILLEPSSSTTQRVQTTSKEKHDPELQESAKNKQTEVNFDHQNLTKSRRGSNMCHTNCTSLANTVLVAESSTTERSMPSTPRNTKNTVASSRFQQKTSTEKDESSSFSYIRQSLRKQGVPPKARDIILKSWRSSTKKQYHTYIDKWFHYCGKSQNPLNPSINSILKFLSTLFENGLNYSAMNTARSALSVFLKVCSNMDIHENSLVTRFMKGCFTERPALPRYQSTWDVNIVLNYLHKQKQLTLLQLSQKLCMLFLLVSAQRCQTLHLLKIGDIAISDDKESVTISISSLLKQSRPSYHLNPIVLHKYTGKRNICIVHTFIEYLERTKTLRADDSLIISTTKPHKAASQSTISRWVKLIMTKAGVGDNYKPHSTRAAATSMANKKGVPLQTIVNTAGWSNATTFAKFYNKTIETTSSLQSAIMSP